MTNIQRLSAAVKTAQTDAMLVTGPSSRRWATGFASTEGMLLVWGDGARFFVDSRYFEAAERDIKDAEVRLVQRGSDFYQLINETLRELGAKTLGFEEHAVSYATYKRLSEKLEAELCEAGSLVLDLRASKTAAELEGLKKAQAISEKSFLETLSVIRRGMTEKELAAELTCRMLKNGADDKSFDPIVVSGRHTSVPHGVPEDRALVEGFLTMDFGVRKDGWCSDTTRTVCIGEPTEEMIRVYDTVLRAQEAGIAAARAGMSGEELDGAARRIIEEAGYGQYFGHAFGHGIGLDIHESPVASPGVKEKLPAGAVVSAEPGVYIPGKFGVRIEDVLYLTENGSENLTHLPKNLQILEL
ncbi:MAG: aminopeptidase P family protein [Oscillospiraceae bacterium]|nr:aminopeptidase P family protein [Oscillospiraceae bacterium]